MKFCTHCGVPLDGSAASFCPECGKPLKSEAKVISLHPAGSRQTTKHPPITTRRHQPSGRGAAKRPAPYQTRKKQPVPPVRPKPGAMNDPAHGHMPVKNPMDENYDGYYEDRATDDNGQHKDALEPELIKRVAFIAAGAILIVILAIILMYSL